MRVQTCTHSAGTGVKDERNVFDPHKLILDFSLSFLNDQDTEIKLNALN